MSVSAGFLWRFLDDVWDLLPTEDRQLFESYWMGFIQVGGALQSRIIEAALSPIVETVPVFLTERWNRFVMDDVRSDLLQRTETLTLSQAAAMPLGVETALYDTFTLTSASGSIPYGEAIEFFDGSIRTLRYGRLLANTVSVKIGPVEYTPGHDYVVNLVQGTIQALDGGRLPIDQVATVTYAHASYTRGLDFEIDEAAAKVALVEASAIADGAAVVAAYTYNATPTLPLQSAAGVISSALTSLADETQNFGALLPNRTLTILSGPNAGSYSVIGILGPTEIAIDPRFLQPEAGGGVAYTIDAFPHGTRIAKNIVSIPTLQEQIDAPTIALEEGVDYVVRGGILAARASFPMMTLGPTEDRTRALWAEKTLVDKETPYRNFGVLIDFYRQNSEAYKQALEGLWFAFWTGSTPENLRKGLHILLGLPYARAAGTVVGLTPPTTTSAGEAQIQDARGQILSYVLPAELDATVALGQEVARFTPLTTGVRIFDRNSDPSFVASRLGRAGIARFLTANASRGPGDTDETRALTLLEHHLFIPQVLTEALTSLINVKELLTFLTNMKPKWTEFVFSFNADVDESVTVSNASETVDVADTIDASTTINNNEANREYADGIFIVARSTGELVVGNQTTGNFRDLGVDFSALGIDAGDVVRISSPGFVGYHAVLARVSASLLSIDIPDSLLTPAVDLQYVILPRELLLGHDAMNLKREHVRRPGTTYFAPTVLNVRTDADLSGLEDADVAALLLVDGSNAGSEVQPVAAARVDLDELEVASAPSLGARPHALASAALTRAVSGSVTDALAI